MPVVWFEPMILAFMWAKTVHALHGAAIVISNEPPYIWIIQTIVMTRILPTHSITDPPIHLPIGQHILHCSLRLFLWHSTWNLFHLSISITSCPFCSFIRTILFFPFSLSKPSFSPYTVFYILFTLRKYFFFQQLCSPCGAWPLFQFPDLFTIGRTPWTSDQPTARPLPKHRTAQTQNKHIYTPNIPALSGIWTHEPSVRARESQFIP
jgi:hypothetical protein